MLLLKDLRGPPNPSRSERRLIRDMSEARYDAINTRSQIVFPDSSKMTLFTVTINVDEGFYAGSHMVFRFSLPDKYPFVPPDVVCTSPVFHPKFDPENGSLLLPLIGQDWSPVCNFNTVIFAIELLFLDVKASVAPPNLNQKCADLLSQDLNLFKSFLQISIRNQHLAAFSAMPSHKRKVEMMEHDYNFDDDEDNTMNGGGKEDDYPTFFKRPCLLVTKKADMFDPTNPVSRALSTELPRIMTTLHIQESDNMEQ